MSGPEQTPRTARGIVFSNAYRHSDTEHMVLACKAAGIPYRFLVPHDTNASWSLARRIAPNSRVTHLLRKRAYVPPARSVSALPAMFYAAALKVGVGDKTSVRWRHAHDNAVARRVERMRPAAFVGITAHCTESMEAARRVGATTFLNVNNHAWDAMEGFEREIALARTDLEAADIQAEVAPPARYAAKNRELELADVVIAESRRIQSAVIERGVDPENVFYLPQAVDLEAFTPSERPGGARKLNVIYVGSIGYRKGLRWIGEAVERAPGAVNRFTIVGYVLVSARELQRRLAPVATFTGEVPHTEVVRHYQQADVFVLTSFAEGMVRVVLEAMASGLPVIVTPNTGYEGVITDGVEGFFVPTFDADAIAEKLTLLANDADLRLRMGRAARALAEQYPWSRFEATFLRELTARVPRLA